MKTFRRPPTIKHIAPESPVPFRPLYPRHACVHGLGSVRAHDRAGSLTGVQLAIFDDRALLDDSQKVVGRSVGGVGGG